jgi:hypothetical protein
LKGCHYVECNEFKKRPLSTLIKGAFVNFTFGAPAPEHAYVLIFDKYPHPVTRRDFYRCVGGDLKMQKLVGELRVKFAD